MRAVVCNGHGDEKVLQVAHIPSPQPAAQEIRIQVGATGVNRADLLQRRGLYPPPKGASEIIGLECSGRIEAVGSEVNDFAVGERVMALLAGGGYAEQVVVPAVCAWPTPDRLDDTQAAAVPEAFLTAYLNLFMLGGLEGSQKVLLHGGSGGVGTAAIQLINAAGARVMVTAGSDERCARCRDLGAELAVNHRSEDFAEICRDWTAGAGVPLILDCIGGAYLEGHLQILARGGRLVLIGLMGGSLAEIDLAKMLGKGLQLVGSTLRSRPTSFKAELVRRFRARFGSALERGEIAPVVHRTLPLDQAAEAHRALAAGEVFGKLVLAVGEC